MKKLIEVNESEVRIRINNDLYAYFIISPEDEVEINANGLFDAFDNGYTFISKAKFQKILTLLFKFKIIEETKLVGEKLLTTYHEKEKNKLIPYQKETPKEHVILIGTFCFISQYLNFSKNEMCEMDRRLEEKGGNNFASIVEKYLDVKNSKRNRIVSLRLTYSENIFDLDDPTLINKISPIIEEYFRESWTLVGSLSDKNEFDFYHKFFQGRAFEGLIKFLSNETSLKNKYLSNIIDNPDDYSYSGKQNGQAIADCADYGFRQLRFIGEFYTISDLYNANEPELLKMKKIEEEKKKGTPEEKIKLIQTVTPEELLALRVGRIDTYRRSLKDKK